MTEADIIDILKSALWVAFMVSLPILTVTLVVGTAIGLLQALTSIQELTLTFVPKLLAIFITFWLSMSFMGQTIISLYQDEIIRIISGR